MNDFEKYVHDQRMKLLEFNYFDIRAASFEDVKAQILEFYGTYDFIVDNLGPCVVYRVRKIKPGADHKMASDVWHPRAECVTKIGRANAVNDPIFYGSLFSGTAIEEAKISPGDEFLLATYKLNPLGYFETSSVVIKQAPPYFGNDEFRQLGVELSAFMVKEFTRSVTASEDEHFYKITCSISQILFSVPHKDSIIYPSVKNTEGINIAMKSAAADSRLNLIEVATCRMDSCGKLFAISTSLPAKDGSLIIQPHSHRMPAPLNIGQPQFRFSERYSYDQIPSTEKLMERLFHHFKENK